MPESIAQYDIIGQAGSGRHGPVYRARDTRVGRTVAIRLLGEGDGVTDPWRRAHFLENVRPFTALSHPHIASLFEAGEHQGRAYLVYEFVPGEKLSALTAGHPLNLRRALDLAVQIADAMAEAYASGLVHGALGPSSVIVTPKGHAKILDFGLAYWQPDEASDDRVLPPEQTAGQAPDHRSDIYAIGAILYRLLTGRNPVPREIPAQDGSTVSRVVVPPSRANLDVPAQVDGIVMKALSPSPDERQADPTILASELRGAASEVHAWDADHLAVEHKPRGWRTVLRALVLAALFVSALAVAAWQWREPIAHRWQSYFGPPLPPVLTVMPFDVADADAARAHLGPGLAEELASRLGHIPGVLVLGRTSMRTFAGKDPRVVADEHRASLAVTARLTPHDEGWDRLDIRVTLLSRETGEGVWSRRYEVEARDLLAAQAKIAEDIATRLAVAFTPAAPLRRAALRLVQPEALDAYLQARTAMAELDTNRAVRLYESALVVDPGMIEARAGLAEALYASAAFEHRLGYAEIARRLQQTAAEAVTADPDLAHSQLAMGLASQSVEAAMTHLRRALDLDPSDTAIYLAAASRLRDIDPAVALRLLGWARTLDPGQPLVRFEIAAANLVLNQPDQVLVEVARGQALAPALPWWDALRLRVRLTSPATASDALPEGGRSLPGFPPGVVVRAELLEVLGQRDAAIAAVTGVVRLFPGFCEARAVLAGMLRATNRTESVRLASEIFQNAQSAPDALARCAAMMAASVGDGRAAAAWIDRAARSDAGLLLWATANGVLSAQAGIRQKAYPWSVVGGSSDFSAAAGRLDGAMGRSRAIVARILDGVTDPLASQPSTR